VEESSTHGPTGRRRRGARADSENGARESVVGAPRIQGELLKLALHVCQATVAKYLARRPTVTYRLLFVLVLLAHDRRRIVHVAVTSHPTAAWTAQ
jgi:hypothetical protein